MHRVSFTLHHLLPPRLHSISLSLRLFRWREWRRWGGWDEKGDVTMWYSVFLMSFFSLEFSVCTPTEYFRSFSIFIYCYPPSHGVLPHLHSKRCGGRNVVRNKSSEDEDESDAGVSGHNINAHQCAVSCCQGCFCLVPQVDVTLSGHHSRQHTLTKEEKELCFFISFTLITSINKCWFGCYVVMCVDIWCLHSFLSYSLVSSPLSLSHQISICTLHSSSSSWMQEARVAKDRRTRKVSRDRVDTFSQKNYPFLLFLSHCDIETRREKCSSVRKVFSSEQCSSSPSHGR